jgi:hypothetical protein
MIGPYRRLRRSFMERLRDSLLCDIRDDLGSVRARVDALERRAFNRRFFAMEQIGNYLAGAHVPGDYLEFGVYRGDTFRHAYEVLSRSFPAMRFFAFDSFEGLPEPSGVDAREGYTGNFSRGEFACDEKEFMEGLRAARADVGRVVTVKGWFADTLKPGPDRGYGIDKAAFAWIDCDLYESTVPVLDFLAPRLTVGSVLVFDDWRCYRNLPDFGEQRACREWLASNPRIRLNELLSFGWHGIAFTVAGV